ncbi:MAG: TIGR02530 family flagellar biosynthesis protein [Eubacteriales bacterium]
MSDQTIGKNYNMNDALVRQAERIKSNNSQEAINIKPVSGRSFQEILQEQLKTQVSFSKHATQRFLERNIQMSPEEMTKLNEACDKATQKGIRDALVIMDRAAFIVNTPNKLVVTVVDKNEMQNNVFTQIDGAVFL